MRDMDPRRAGHLRDLMFDYPMGTGGEPSYVPRRGRAPRMTPSMMGVDPLAPADYPAMPEPMESEEDMLRKIHEFERDMNEPQMQGPPVDTWGPLPRAQALARLVKGQG